jgi:hypothetical protein
VVRYVCDWPFPQTEPISELAKLANLFVPPRESLPPPPALIKGITKQRLRDFGLVRTIKLDPGRLQMKRKAQSRGKFKCGGLKEDTHCQRHPKKRPHQPRQPMNIFALHHQLLERIHPIRPTIRCNAQRFKDMRAMYPVCSWPAAHQPLQIRGCQLAVPHDHLPKVEETPTWRTSEC